MQLIVFSGLFTAIIIAANFMAVKLVDVWRFLLPAAVLCYPFAFVMGDLITEFYGFKTTRKIIFLIFALNAVVMGFLALAAILPPSGFFAEDDAGFRRIFLSAPRVLGASFTAFIASGLLNSHLFDRIKRTTRLPLMARSAISTFFAVLADSAVFIALAFAGKLPLEALLMLIAGQVIAKLVIGIGIGVPLTWCVVKGIGRAGRD